MIGSFVFLWGQKQERTPTWYGLFTANGEETETVDVMHKIWTGDLPANRSPSLLSMLLDGKNSQQDVELKSGHSYQAVVDAIDPGGDSLTYSWELKQESDARQVGGDFESSIDNLNVEFTQQGQPLTHFNAPRKPGAYRLFVYAFDGNNHAAHANIPFLVTR